MAADGAGTQAWDFDRIVDAPDLRGAYARQCIAPLERRATWCGGCSVRIARDAPAHDVPSDIFDISAFEAARHRAPMKTEPDEPRLRVPILNVPCTRFALEARAPVRHQSAGSRSS